MPTIHMLKIVVEHMLCSSSMDDVKLQIRHCMSSKVMVIFYFIRLFSQMLITSVYGDIRLL